MALQRNWLVSFLLLFSLLGTVALLLSRVEYRAPQITSADGEQCISRLEQHLYYGRDDRRARPSPYFISKLREYEKMHQRCAKEAESFSQMLSSNSTAHVRTSSSGCQFVVWISYQGLGNKMLTMGSAFLYALVTNRVLLLDRGSDMPELFCEPFPGTSWFVPTTFPHDYLHSLNTGSPNKLGRLLQVEGDKRCEASNGVNSLPNVVYVHIAADSHQLDQRFYCKREQELLSQVKWLLLRADVYYIPQLYYMDSFREEFQRMFPDQDQIFHHTARYLFNPSNSIWERTKRFYHTYLADGDVLVGYQIRPVDKSEKVRDNYWQQALDCGLQKGILPNVTSQARRVFTRKILSDRETVVNLLVVSLDQRYYDRFRDFYLEHPTRNKSTIVKVHFASHEAIQQTDSLEHDKKAVMEVYLLAMCDVLVTTSRSTYGYIAHGFGGIKPWTIRGAFDDTEAGKSQPCFRISTIDPCFLRWVAHDCDCRGSMPMPSGLKRCQDAPWGVRILREIQ